MRIKIKILIFFSLFVIIAGLGFALFLFSLKLGKPGHLPDEEELRNLRNETATLVYSEDGVIIGKFFARNRTNISYDQFPETLIQALLSVEDVRFFEHQGVDSRSMARVFFRTLLQGHRSSGGGSTISQQLVKNLYGRRQYRAFSLPVNKMREALIAARLEKIYTKEEILTLYMNTVPFGENVYGIEAAAGRYFNKQAQNLKTEESAVLVGMLRANTVYNPRLYPGNAFSRRNVVLSQMHKYGFLEFWEADSLQKLPMDLDYANLTREGPANYFLVRVRREAVRLLKEIEESTGKVYDIEKDGLIITTTLDHKLQSYALEAFKRHLKEMQPKLRSRYKRGDNARILRNLASSRLESTGLSVESDSLKLRELFSWDGFYNDSISAFDSILHSLTLLHAGLVAMDPKNGAIRAWVGGIDFRTQPYDQIMAKRQSASAFKPFLYAAALEDGLGPCTYLENDSIYFDDHHNWSPSNYDNSTGGNYSMSAALAKSMNIPTVNLFMQTDFDKLRNIWEQLGFTSELHNGPAVALGTCEASALELCVGYAAFANGGFKVSPAFIESIETEDGVTIYQRDKVDTGIQLLEERTVLLMNEMLKKAIDQGTGHSIRTIYGVNQPLSGKTGTSQDYSDAWFACYTPKLVMVTRVGASLPSIRFGSGIDGSGSALALPLAGLTLANALKDSRLKLSVFSSFPSTPDDLAHEIDCEDYIEKGILTDFFEFFKPKSDAQKRREIRAEQKEKQRQGLFKRIFGKKK